MAKKTYRIVGPVRHDGIDLEIGGTLKLEERDAGALLASGAIVDPEAEAAAAAAEAAAAEAAAAAQAGGDAK